MKGRRKGKKKESPLHSPLRSDPQVIHGSCLLGRGFRQQDLTPLGLGFSRNFCKDCEKSFCPFRSAAAFRQSNGRDRNSKYSTSPSVPLILSPCDLLWICIKSLSVSSFGIEYTTCFKSAGHIHIVTRTVEIKISISALWV